MNTNFTSHPVDLNLNKFLFSGEFVGWGRWGLGVHVVVAGRGRDVEALVLVEAVVAGEGLRVGAASPAAASEPVVLSEVVAAAVSVV